MSLPCLPTVCDLPHHTVPQTSPREVDKQYLQCGVWRLQNRCLKGHIPALPYCFLMPQFSHLSSGHTVWRLNVLMSVKVSEQCLEHWKCLMYINPHFCLNTVNRSGEKWSGVLYGSHWSAYLSLVQPFSSLSLANANARPFLEGLHVCHKCFETFWLRSLLQNPLSSNPLPITQGAQGLAV